MGISKDRFSKKRKQRTARNTAQNHRIRKSQILHFSVYWTDFSVLDANQIWKSGLNKYIREISKKAKILLSWSSQILKPKFKKRKKKDSFDYYMRMLRYCKQLSGNLRPNINSGAPVLATCIEKNKLISTFKYFIKGTFYFFLSISVIILETLDLEWNILDMVC